MDEEAGQVPSRDIVADDGRVLMFSTERFLRDIIAGDHCFICGVAPGAADFNAEHVIPRWILKRYRLFELTITLPNGRRIRYDRLTVPCCQSCNSFLGRTVEERVAALLDGAAPTVLARIGEMQRDLLFVWLTLLFVKIHLKDRLVRWNSNPGDGLETVAQGYEWEDFHHMFEVARSPFTGARLSPGTRGTLVILPVDDMQTAEAFDFLDFTDQATIAIRLGDIGIIAVLNDARLAEHLVSNHLRRVTAPVSCVQLREIAARLAMANADLTSRPIFQTMVSRVPAFAVLLRAAIPPLRYEPYEDKHFGRLLSFALEDRIANLVIDGSNDPNYVRRALASGQVSFLGKDG